MKTTKTNNRLLTEIDLKFKTDKASNDAEFFEKRIAVEWLSTRQAAKFLSISPNALRILVHRGRIKAFKFGNRLRFRLADLRYLLLQKEA